MRKNVTEHPESKRRIPWGRLLIGTVVILVLLPCLGLMSSVVYSGLRRAGDLSRWQLLGRPPEGGVEIIAGDTGVVYVRSEVGKVYGCEHSKSVADNCWHETQEPYDVDPKATYDSRLYQGDVEPPPGRVVDTLEVTVWQAEDAFETRYILLEDGMVWKREYDVGAYYSLSILILGPVAGLVIGIVAVFILWLGVGLRSLKQRQ